jgi:hypothetical protein
MSDKIRPWFLDAEAFARLPEEYRVAIRTILMPVYRALILEVENPVERATGNLIVALIAVELREQVAIGGSLTDRTLEVGSSYDKCVNRLLRVAQQRLKALGCLERLRCLTETPTGGVPVDDPLLRDRHAPQPKPGE